MDKLTVVAWNAINGAPMVFEESALSVIAARDARIKELREALEIVVSTILSAEDRCMAADGPVTLTSDEITEGELTRMYIAARVALSKED